MTFKAHRLSVAPMMDWTDRHCRTFHRLMTRRALLYTEMVTAAAVLNGDRERLLGHDRTEHPLALQLGGSRPADLAAAVRAASDWGFEEINLNVGCPSDRVRSGAFGAVLMERPSLVAECAAAMMAASNGPEITVKCRIGVDHQDPREVLPAFLETIAAAGVRRVQIHARKAWLHGLSPKRNRSVPPLDHALVVAMKREFPSLDISLNGGVATLDQAETLLALGLDGVMIGRAAYHTPADVLLDADRRIFGDARAPLTRAQVVARMVPYMERHLAAGGRLGQVTRHMLGLFAGRPGARLWRQRLSSPEARRPGAGLEVLHAALAEVSRAGHARHAS